MYINVQRVILFIKSRINFYDAIAVRYSSSTQNASLFSVA